MALLMFSDDFLTFFILDDNLYTDNIKHASPVLKTVQIRVGKNILKSTLIADESTLRNPI
jgi:hypothetical protein